MTLNAALEVFAGNIGMAATNMERLHEATGNVADAVGKIPVGVQVGGGGPGSPNGPMSPDLAKGAGDSLGNGWRYWLSGGGVNAGIAYLPDPTTSPSYGASYSRNTEAPGPPGRWSGSDGGPGHNSDAPPMGGGVPPWRPLNAPPIGPVIPGAPGTTILPPAMVETQQAQLTEAQKQTSALNEVVRLLSGDSYLAQRAAGNI